MIQDASIHEALAFLLEHLPDRLHLLVSTRVDPPWPLARFRARDQLVEIRSSDLRFTLQETAAFLNQTMDLQLSSESVAALEARTEGWIASLQLAPVSMRGRSDIPSFIQAFTGRHVFVADYLMEEVLGRQPEEVKRFLLQTSILDRMNASLCEAVSGLPDGQLKLKSLQQANLFLISLDDEGLWFRYHRLFVDLLRARIQHDMPVEKLNALHPRAAAWYEQAGMMSEAMEHLLAAGDDDQAVTLLEKLAPQMILKAYFKTLENWLHLLRSQSIRNSARLNMTLAWMYLMRRDVVQAGPTLSDCRTYSRNPKQLRSTPPCRVNGWHSNPSF